MSINDIDEVLPALFGESIRGPSPSTISRLESICSKDYSALCKRDWRGQEMVHLWADGTYLNARAADRRRVLVPIGCDAHGDKHFLAIDEGYREETKSWKVLLLSLRDRGLTKPQKLAVGDGVTHQGHPAVVGYLLRRITTIREFLPAVHSVSISA